MEKEKKEEQVATVDVRKLLVDRFGETQVSDWEKAYHPRKLNVIEVEDKIAVLRPIGAKEISGYSMALVDPTKGLDVATEYLLEELWLDGDNEIRDDEEYFISSMLQLQNVVETKKSRFTKL
jgi:hypothetical protein